jgi:4-hydroxythreonine-4-phosphate dehydrogenase
MPALPRIAVSMGDPCGIGPEVTALALSDPRVHAALLPLVCGDAGALEAACRLRGLRWPLPGVLLRAVTGLAPADRVPGRPSGDGGAAGAAALAYVDAGIDAVLANDAQGLCTAPLSKARVAARSPSFHGHTEHLAARFGAEVAMMLAGPRLRVALATNHEALRDVPGLLTSSGVLRVVRLVHRELQLRFAVARPRIAVLGLNPHAGDGGLFGDEEARILAPALAAAREGGIDATGPHPADGFFPKAARGACDAVVALYHDQGLIAAKLLDFQQTVNVTLGLPAPRTSPDHGTADDIAGTGKADPEPMISALLLCARLAAQAQGTSTVP